MFWVVDQDKVVVCRSAHVELKTIAPTRKSVFKCGKRILWVCAATAPMPEQQRTVRGIRGHAILVEIEIAQRTAGIGSFLRPLHRFLEFLLQHVRRILLRLYGLPEE